MYRIENNEKCNICINNNKIDLSMTAKEMFEELGYILVNHYPYYMFYYKQFDKIDDSEMGMYHIEFDYKTKEINKSYGDDNTVANITLKELKAINKQVEELGWK